MDQVTLNILKLAASSYDAKNFRDCENFCNQVIAQDYNCSYAWKLKAQAVNMQSGPRNPRLSEVYTCLTNYIQLSPENEREASEKNAFVILYNSYQGEIKMHLAQFEAGRPNNAAKDQIVSLWNEFNQQMTNLYNVCKYQSARLTKPDLQTLFYKESKKAILETCKRSWENTVAYNYYRDDRHNGGSNWKTKGRDYSSGYRPSESIFDTFVAEITVLQNILWAFTVDPRDVEDADILIKFCDEAIYLQRKKESAHSFKRMVETTTNGYGAIIDRTEYWESQYYMKPNPAYMKQWEDQKEKYAKWKREKKEQAEKERVEKYWREHPTERTELIRSINALQAQKKEYENSLANVGAGGLNEEISKIETSIAGLGMFKNKEKKQLQEKLDKLKTDKSEQEKSWRTKIVDCENSIKTKQRRLNNP